MDAAAFGEERQRLSRVEPLPDQLAFLVVAPLSSDDRTSGGDGLEVLLDLRGLSEFA